MKNVINENCLVCITSQNKVLKIEYLPFEDNPLNYNPNFLKLTDLADSKKGWENIRDQGYELAINIRNQLNTYFHKEEVLTSPSDAYATENTIGKSTTLSKIHKKIPESEKNFYIFSEDKEHQYTLSDLIRKLDLTFTNYLYKEAVQQAKSRKVLAYSHRKFGWNREPFDLDKNFKIAIDTNFGYGWSSYFHLTIYFNEIPIIPYTKIIYYRYVNASSLLHFTESYDVDFQSFKSSFQFVTNEINSFNVHGKDTFIYKHIIQSLDELTELMDKILNNDIFYFVDENKIDTYLDLNGRNIIYDYEHLLTNINPKAINEIALYNFLKEYDKLTFTKLERDEENALRIKLNNELSKLVLNESIRSQLKEGYNIERYGYAIAILLSKYSDQNSFWQKLNDDQYNLKTHQIIKQILNVEQNYSLLMNKKSGHDLMVFRNERILLAIDFIGNIRGLEKLINASKYVNKIRESASKMILQNRNYLEKNEPLLQLANKQYLMDLDNYTIANQEFKSKILSKQYNYYHDLLSMYKDLVKLINYDLSKSSFTFDSKFDTQLETLVAHIKGSTAIASLNTDEVFSLGGFGNNNSSNSWSMKRLREEILKSQSETYKEVLKLMLKIVKTWYDFLPICELNISHLEIRNKFKEMLYEIDLLIKNINLNLKSTMDFNHSFNDFVSSFFDNHIHYIKLKPLYIEASSGINELKINLDTSEQKYKVLLRYKEDILKSIKQLEEKLNE